MLGALFELHDPPLVLKHDNGPGLIAEIVQLLLACYGVLSLRSPPYCPRYNGSCEAGVGSLSRRTERLAAAAEDALSALASPPMGCAAQLAGPRSRADFFESRSCLIAPRVLRKKVLHDDELGLVVSTLLGTTRLERR